jgi:PEGA domain
MTALIDPTVRRFPNFRALFTSAPRIQLLLGTAFLILLVLGVFAFFYIQEWRLRRGFRRFWQRKSKGNGVDPSSAESVSHSRNALILVPKEQLSQGSPRGPRQNPGEHIAAVDQSRSLWLINTQTQSSGGAGSAGTRRGVLNVEADDESCEIFIDGGFLGNLPAKIKVPEGTHLVEVKRNGYEDYRREIRVVADAELTLRPVLEKNVPSGQGQTVPYALKPESRRPV